MVLNLSQQTDSSDLLGGFRPLQAGDLVISMLDRFADLVRRTWWRGSNDEYLTRISRLAEKQRWQQIVKAMKGAIQKLDFAEVEERAEASTVMRVTERTTKQKKALKLGRAQVGEWQKFREDLAVAERACTAAESSFAFAFVEGTLVQALREGWWLLLDEVNLAPPEVRVGVGAWLPAWPPIKRASSFNRPCCPSGRRHCNALRGS